MRKLETLKNNIARMHGERKAAESALKNVQKVTARSLSIADQVMQPPQDLINLYLMEAEVYTRENLLGDCTRTREQMRVMLEDTLMGKWRVHSASDAMGGSNHRSYWKPSVRTWNGYMLQLFLGDKLIGSLS
jgi:hypothetical protein